MSSINARLAALGITLPKPMAPVANYVPFVITGNLLVISGQVSGTAEGLITGRLGAGVSIDEGQRAARACAINLMAQMLSALGDLERVTRIVRLGGFINAAPDFHDTPKVMNGASDLIGEVFGERGRHARSTVGVAVLPMNCAVEVEAMVEFK